DVRDHTDSQEHALERSDHGPALGSEMRAAAIGPTIGADVEAEEPFDLAARRVDDAPRDRLVGREAERAENRTKLAQLAPGEAQLGDSATFPGALVRVAEVCFERVAKRREQIRVRVGEVRRA